MNTKRILVTGVNGFVGNHLVNELRSRGVSVIGAANIDPTPELLEKLEKFVLCDLTKAEDAAKLDFSGVDAVIHLAALASQAMSFEKPQLFISLNSAMVINVFEQILAQKLETQPRVVMISSGAVYDSKQEMPITETSKVTHSSPYAISKLLGENLGDYYRTRGIDSIVVRPFNHIGPGQIPGFILPDFTSRLLEIGKDGILQTGNLATKRDYTDVRDVVRAYADIALAPEVKGSLYNICSGKARSGQEMLDTISNALFGEGTKIQTEVDQNRIRPNDPLEIVGSTERLQTDYGWRPAIPFEQTIKDYVEWASRQQQA